MKQFEHFSKEIFMVLESRGGCYDAMIDGSEPPGGWCEVYILFQRKHAGLEFPGGSCEAICTMLQRNKHIFIMFGRYSGAGWLGSLPPPRQPAAACGRPLEAPLETFEASRARFEGSIRLLHCSIARCWRLA